MRFSRKSVRSFLATGVAATVMLAGPANAFLGSGIVLDPSKRKRPSEFSVVCTIVQVLTIPDISKTLVGRKTLKK